MIAPAETTELLRFPFAGGHRVLCIDCDGTGELESRWYFSCPRCDGKGLTLEVFGPKDEDQRHFEALVREGEIQQGRSLTFAEGQELRDRVRASRPVRGVE